MGDDDDGVSLRGSPVLDKFGASFERIGDVCWVIVCTRTISHGFIVPYHMYSTGLARLCLHLTPPSGTSGGWKECHDHA